MTAKKAKPDLTSHVLKFATFDPEEDRVAPCEDGPSKTIHDIGAWSQFIARPAPRADVLDEHEARGHEDASAEHRARRLESQERCDTDGFLSQWASGISANERSIAATIARNGGTDLFPGLYDAKTGERIRAKLIDGRFGPCWAIVGEDGRFTGKFLGDRRGPRAALAKAGLVVCGEYVKAEACIAGTGTGLSGRAWATSRRLDEGFPVDAVPLK